MNLRGWGRAYVVWVLVLALLAYLAWPSAQALDASVWEDPAHHPFSPFAGSSFNGLDYSDAMFSVTDCELGTSKLSAYDGPKSKFHAPFIFECVGNPVRWEFLQLMFLLAIAPVAGFLAFRWVRKGFRADA